MSIVACVRVYDGIVLGAESMTQLFGQVGGQARFLKAYSNAKKLFQVGTLPVGVLIYGAGNVGTRSIESFVDEFSEGVGLGQLTVQQLATNFRDFFAEAYNTQFGQTDPNQRPNIGFYFAGYSPTERIGADWEFIFPSAEVVRPRPSDFGASWRGISLPFTRLYAGYDPRILGIMQSVGIAQNLIDSVQQQANTALASQVAFDGMPVQDAVGYCEFILRTTIATSTYELGVPTCGGPLQVAVITKREGFAWVARPRVSLIIGQGEEVAT